MSRSCRKGYWKFSLCSDLLRNAIINALINASQGLKPNLHTDNNLIDAFLKLL